MNKTTQYPSQSIEDQIKALNQSVKDDNDYVNKLVKRLSICLVVLFAVVILLVIFI